MTWVGIDDGGITAGCVAGVPRNIVSELIGFSALSFEPPLHAAISRLAKIRIVNWNDLRASVLNSDTNRTGFKIMSVKLHG